MQIAINKAAAQQALSDTWHAALGFVRDTASANTQALDQLAAELAPDAVALGNEWAAGSAAGGRALTQVQAMIKVEAVKLGLHDLADASAKLDTGMQTAIRWLAVLAKAIIL